MTARGHGSGKVHMVWTRAIQDGPMAGRPNAARQIRAMLGSAGFTISESTIYPLTSRLTFGRIVGALCRLLASLLRGRPLPLQCLLFGAHDQALRVVAELPDGCRLVYLDGVRCLQVLEALRRTRPDLAVLTDLDDLMSRRMELLLELDEPPSTGYLKGQVPALAERLLGLRLPARIVLRYEAASLRIAERRVAALSDAVALISTADAQLLCQRAPGHDVRSIPFAVNARPRHHRLLRPPFRFVFIGTDALRQNQLTIDALIALWRRENIATPLVIFGEQHRHYDLPRFVSMPGYADTLEAVYDCHSILLTPSYMAGGVKTKVLEGFAFSVPVVGNAITFESIQTGPDYPLLFGSEAAMLRLLHEPERYVDRFAAAVEIGGATIHNHHNPGRVEQAWSDIARAAMSRRSQLAGLAGSSDRRSGFTATKLYPPEPRREQSVQ